MGSKGTPVAAVRSLNRERSALGKSPLLKRYPGRREGGLPCSLGAAGGDREWPHHPDPEGLGGVWTPSPDPGASWGHGSDQAGSSGWVTRHGDPWTRDSSPQASVQAGDIWARQQGSAVPWLTGALPGAVAKKVLSVLGNLESHGPGVQTGPPVPAHVSRRHAGRASV